MLHEHRDSRVRRTIGRIRQAFRDLVLENDYNTLNVSMLCERAHIGRKTFYVYYPSLEALFEEELERITMKYLERVKGYSPPDHFSDIAREFYLFSVEQGKFYESLICATSYHSVGEKLMIRLIRETWRASPWFMSLKEEYQTLLVGFIYNAGAGLYRSWILSGKAIPMEMMGRIADSLLMGGVGGLRNLL